jgi:hypothetical protein
MLNEAYLAADSMLDALEDVESSLRWIAYFRTNEHQLIDLPWDAGVALSAEERSALIPSIQDFQLGESSEGVNPKRLAEEYARRSGDVHYPEAMRIFLGEEHRHARLLGRYLDLAGAPRLEYSWDDAIFRRLRRLIGMEFMLMTLLMAETIAKIYYRALYHASACKLLRRICAQILRDEKPHVEFHVERLAIMRRGRTRWFSFVVAGVHRAMFAATCLAVWIRHKPTLRRGGYPFRAFWALAWKEFAMCL